MHLLLVDIGGIFMAAVAFDPTYFSVAVFLSALVPGLAIGLPLLRKSAMGATEKLLTCLFLGLVMPPLMLVVENSLGVAFSLPLVFANLVLLTAFGAFMAFRSGFHPLPALPDLDRLASADYLKSNLAPAILLAVVFLAFFLRIQTYSPIYSELDPYFYVYGTGQIIRDGSIPYSGSEDTACWPEVKTQTHRYYTPLKMFMEAQWYALYTSGGAFSNYLLFITSSWLPPVSGALLAFGAYLLFYSYFGSRRYGLLAAFLATFVPIMVFKMSAGVNEAAPFGMASIFFILGFYAFSLKNSDRAVAAIAGLSFAAAALGSNYDSMIAYPLAAFLVLIPAISFVRGWGKGQESAEAHASGGHKHASKEGAVHSQALALISNAFSQNPFIMASTFLVGGFFAGSLLQGIYTYGFDMDGLTYVLSGSTLLPLFGLAAAYLIEIAPSLYSLPQKRRRAIAAAVFLAALLVLIVPNPLGGYLKGVASQYIGAADLKLPLDRTIAEQNVAGSSFENEAGFLAFVPRNYMAANTTSGMQQAWNLAYGSMDAVSATFTSIGNASLQGATYVFNSFLGRNIVTVEKQSTLAFVFIIVAVIWLIHASLASKGEKSRAALSLMLLLILIPTAYIGMNKIKFTLFVGIALIMAAVLAVGALESAALLLARRIKFDETYVRGLFLFAMFGLAYAQIAFPPAVTGPDGPGIFPPGGYMVLPLYKSLDVRYQDDQQSSMQRLASHCEEMRVKGYYDPEICAAAYNASFADTINGQYNQKVCVASLLSTSDIFAAADFASQKASAEAKAAAQYRCNRLSEYWIDSMEWISRNLGADDRVTSWWDYGHWTNYFGDRKTVLRNEHVSHSMIGRVAHDFLIGTNQDLIDSMNYFDSRYVLFDVEIIGGESFGAKYGALNYLGCAHEGGTSVRQVQGTSKCEFDHSPEQILVPSVQTSSTLCTISESQRLNGIYAYRVTQSGVDQTSPAYCVGMVELADGSKIPGTYYLDRKDANGDLEVSKGKIRVVSEQQGYVVAEMVYTDEPIWRGQNGSAVGGMEDAKTDFYRSNLYTGFYLEKLPGFDLVYKSANGEVKIFRMKDSLFVGNKQGIVDPESIGREY